MVTVFMSAENPDFMLRPLRANNAQMYILLHDLRRLVPDDDIKLVLYVDRKTGYSEKAFKVTGISLAEAVRLARYYKQKSLIVDGLGDLGIGTMTVFPQTKKHVGEAAYKSGRVSFIEGEKAVSYEFDYDHPISYGGSSGPSRNGERRGH